MSRLVEEQHDLFIRIQKFYARIGMITNEPHLLNEEEAYKLITEVTDIINAVENAEEMKVSPELRLRFETIKQQLLMSMMQTPTNKTMDENGNIKEE